jgi:hypothetical protein
MMPSRDNEYMKDSISKPEAAISYDRLREICGEIADAQCVCEIGTVVELLPNDELVAAHREFLDQFGYELVLGALEKSEWTCGGSLQISANLLCIGTVRTAVELMWDEIEHRQRTGRES